MAYALLYNYNELIFSKIHPGKKMKNKKQVKLNKLNE